MKNKHAIEQVVISSLKNNYGIDVANLTSLSLGTDTDALIYKAKALNKTTYFVKVKRGQHTISVDLQLLLHDSGMKEIIAPIKTLEKEPKLLGDDFTLIVYPFIHGQNGFTQNLTDEQWSTFGKTLKHLHKLQLPPAILPSIRQEDFSPDWRNKVRSIFEHEQQVISANEIASKFLGSLKKNKAKILHLIDKAEELSRIIQKEPINLVLCHGDIHAGNVLIAADGALYIIDWDQPIMAPKERDLMFIGGGVGNVWNNRHEVELFYRGYGKTIINKQIVSYYRCERIIQDVAEYYQQLLSDNVEYKSGQIGYKHFVAMFEPDGVVDIALKIDAHL